MSVNINGYALALFALAEENRALKKYKQEAAAVLQILTNNDYYITLVNTPAFSREARAEIIAKAFASAQPMIVNMLAILASRKQLQYSLRVLHKFISLVNEKLGINEGVIYSTIALSDGDLKAITKRVATQLELNELVLVNKLDHNLIAGFRVEVKDEVIEDSVPARLAALRTALINKKENYGY